MERREFLRGVGTAIWGAVAIVLLPRRARAVVWEFALVDADKFPPAALRTMYAAVKPSEWLCPRADLGDRCFDEAPTISLAVAEQMLAACRWVAVLRRDGVPIEMMPLQRMWSPDDIVVPATAFFRSDLIADRARARRVDVRFMVEMLRALGTRGIRHFTWRHPGRQAKSVLHAGDRSYGFYGAVVSASGRDPATQEARSFRVTFDVPAALTNYQGDDDGLSLG